MKFRSLYQKTSYSFYNFVRHSVADTSKQLNLYFSNTFQGKQTLQDITSDRISRTVFAQLIPLNLETRSEIYTRRFLVTELSFNPSVQTLTFGILNSSGVLKKVFDIKKIVPWTYSDLIASNTKPSAQLPFFIDPEMIYYNLFLREIYLFEKDGVWNEENIKHPDLSVEKQYNERLWHDEFKFF